MAEAFVDLAGEAPVRGFLHLSDAPSKGFLVLTHGAGGNSRAPLLMALSEQLAAAGVTTLRCDLPYRQRRPTGPPSPSDAKHDQAGLRRAVTLMRERFGGRGFMGGVSYGGRQASMLIASEPSLVDGLMLLSYRTTPHRTFAGAAHAYLVRQRNSRCLRLHRRARRRNQADPSSNQADSD
jgi:predicted alpha/beta-hydrolase family hydrolase